jgi:hypothetical protein
MNAKGLKAAAVALLALAIVAVVFAFRASHERVNIQGPSALAVLPDGTVWLGVDEALWKLDREGRRIAVVPRSVHGVPGRIGNLALRGDGRLAAATRGDAAIYLLDGATGQPQGRIVPQWPAELAAHASRAIHFAFHPDGRFAVATGGGHAVALFDAQGGFLARTPDFYYRFTNGLWWAGESLWTTDTNRFALVRLDGRTLQSQQRLNLPGSVFLENRYLGMAVGSPRPELLGVVVRFADGMVRGQAVAVRPDGRQRPFPAGAAEPRDLQWLGETLLMTDGNGYRVRRYAANGDVQPEFGDEAVRRELGSLWERRTTLYRFYRGGLAAAIALFVLGLGCAVAAQTAQRRARVAGLGADFSRLGTPEVPAWRRAVLALMLAWPAVVVFAIAAVDTLHPLRPLTGLPVTGYLILVLSVFLALLLGNYLWLRRRIRRAAGDPATDALFNGVALAHLQKDEAFWRDRLPGELPLETVMLVRYGGPQWLVLTDRRLFLHRVNVRDRVLEQAWSFGQVLSAETSAQPRARWWQRLNDVFSLTGLRLRIVLRDGQVVEGGVVAVQAAQRLADKLSDAAQAAQAAGSSEAFATAPAAIAPAKAAPRAGWAPVLASLLIPGLGQWMQRRSGTALTLFASWAAVTVVAAVPLGWTLWGPRAAVNPRYMAYVVAVYAAVCLSAAFDAWRMRSRA